MIELAKHIEKLLLDNDCVIVPGLGGFVAHYTPSTRIEEENRFLPPTRVIGFTPQVKMNDGLLVQSYMDVYNTSFSDATHIVSRQVDELVQCLHEEGKAELPNVGELRCSIRGTYEFTPYDEKITTPYLYGLMSFEMELLENIRKEVPLKKSVPDYLLIHDRRERKIKLEINLKPSYWINVAAMIALILTFFLFSTPIENTDVVKGNYASLFPEDMLKEAGKTSLAFTPVTNRLRTQPAKQTSETKKPKATNNAKQTTAKQKTGNAAQASSSRTKPAEAKAPVTAREVKVKENSAVAKRYHIIVASVGTENDASQMVRNLVEKGFKGASTVIGDGKNRVSIESCATYAEAQQTLNEVRKNEAYKSAWVLKH